MAYNTTFRWNGYKVIYDAAALDEHGFSGDTDVQAGLIRLHPSERGQRALDTLIHEGMHALDPDMSEAKVGMLGRALAELVHKAGFRQEKNQ